MTAAQPSPRSTTRSIPLQATSTASEWSNRWPSRESLLRSGRKETISFACPAHTARAARPRLLPSGRRPPEFLQDRSLRPLDLPVPVRRALRDRPEPYRFAHQTALDFLSEEFGTAVRLDTLDRERHLLQHLIEECQRGTG
jgi:hypothetical protein